MGVGLWGGLVGWVSVAHPPLTCIRRLWCVIYVIAAKVPFTAAPRSHGNSAARERVKGARRRPLHYPGSRLKNRPCGLPLPPAFRFRSDAIPHPGARALWRFPTASPDSTPRRGGFDAGWGHPFGVGYLFRWWVRRLTHPTGWRNFVGWVSAAHPPLTLRTLNPAPIQTNLDVVSYFLHLSTRRDYYT